MDAGREPAAMRSLLEDGLRELGPDPDADSVVAWGVRVFGRRLAVASSMSDAVIVHLVGQHLPGVDVVFLDTGLHFAETLAYREQVARLLPVTILSAAPELTVEQQAEQFGAELYLRDPAACCRMRKVDVMDGALAPYDAWVTGLRRDDSPTRSATPVLEWDGRRSMVKLNPIAAWSDADVAEYVDRHGLPEHPLRPAGFLSIGCAPCTRAVGPDEPARAGRWTGWEKTECGLHDDPEARASRAAEGRRDLPGRTRIDHLRPEERT